MEVIEIVILLVALGIFIKTLIYDPFVLYWQDKPSIYEQVVSFLGTPIFKISLICLGIILFILLNIWLHKKWLKRSVEKDVKEKQLGVEFILVKKLLAENLDALDSEKLEEFIKNLDELELFMETEMKFGVEILDKLEKAKKRLEEKLRQDELNRYRSERWELQEEIRELEKQKYKEELKLENNHQSILKQLEIEENLVYEVDDLKPEEKVVLNKEKFNEVNEYDPIQDKCLDFFVKQVLNHSPTHTFLVGRIRQLLEQYLDFDKIWIHDTKDADITFEVDYKIYAFEIETGTLLSKKKQLKEKVSFLNGKYGKNWYFVVANRDLRKKYRKYGNVIPRAGVRRIIEKLTDS